MVTTYSAQKIPRYQALIRYSKMLGFGEIHTKVDPKTGLHALIAVHSTDLGPAIGGCRFFEYANAELAFKDALRLAYMMTLKAAACGLHHGGAKSVIFKPRHLKDRVALFRSFGDFVHELNGRYITAIDVGTSTHDMNIIAEHTPYVIGATNFSNVHTDPATHTAQGVMRGIEAAIKFKFNADTVSGLHIAIQGAGHVGSDLARRLIEQGAQVTICDPKPESTKAVAEKYGAKVCSTDDIYSVKCDIFSPCAMGGILSLQNINTISAPIIAGSANNQLAHKKYGRVLHDRGVLYAPDYVINAGGLINAALVYDYEDPQLASNQIDKIYDALIKIFSRSKQENISTNRVAEMISLERLAKAKQHAQQREEKIAM